MTFVFMVKQPKEQFCTLKLRLAPILNSRSLRHAARWASTFSKEKEGVSMYQKSQQFCTQIGISVPIFQAPMAGGPSSPELAAAVSSSGGLGFVAAGYLNPDRFADDYRKAADLAGGSPVGANFFVASSINRDKDSESIYAASLGELADKFGIDVPKQELVFFRPSTMADQLEAIASLDPPVLTFIFGLPEREVIEPVVARGAKIGITVTSVSEALQAAEWGADFLIAQGPEAGATEVYFSTPTRRIEARLDSCRWFPSWWMQRRYRLLRLEASLMGGAWQHA
jgi:hypothetical protein